VYILEEERKNGGGGLISMKITDLEAIPIEIKQTMPFATHRETMEARKYVIVRVYTDQGIIGLGEASTIETWGESQTSSVYSINEIIRPIIVGESPFHLETILARMDQALEGCQYSKAGVEMALFDIMGKAVNKPVYDLIGGPYREWVPISRSVGITDVEKMTDWALMLKEMGTSTIKIKTGISGDHDIEAVHAIRNVIGEETSIKVDANTGWKVAKEAIRVLNAIEDCNIMLAEQPVRSWDLNGMAEVTKAVNIPIAADESVWGPHDVISIFEKRAADILTIYLMKAGGISRNREVACTAKAAGFSCLLGGMGEMGIGSAANIHFAVAIPNLEYPADLHIPPFLLEDDIITEPLDYSENGVTAPKTPGLGVELDEEKVEKYRIDK